MTRLWIAVVLPTTPVTESLDSCGFSNKWRVWIAVVLVINGESVDSCGFSNK